MQYCHKCKIKIKGNKVCCPLCGGELSGTTEPGEKGFPVIPEKRLSRMTVLRMSVFLFVITEIVMFALRYLFPGSRIWTGIVMIGAVVLLLDIAVSMYYRNNVLKLVTVQTYIGMIVILVTDYLTGMHGWSAEWVIPAAFLGLAVFTVSVGRGFHLLLSEYILYLIADILLSLLQIILIAAGWNSFVYPAVISIVLLLIAGAAALIFRFRELRDAAARTFNM